MEWQSFVDSTYREVEPHLGEGRVADYIPALAEADPRSLALSVCTLDGTSYDAGLSSRPFSIQSISKVFALTLALSLEGPRLWNRVGREPSGTSFNSIVQLEVERGIPRNPFINAGAMVIADTIIRHCGEGAAVDRLVALIRQTSQSDAPRVDRRVARSEHDLGDRNRSLAYFMKSFGVLASPAETVLDAYFQNCAVTMTTTELARAGLFLANQGTDAVTGVEIASHPHTNRINALMLTCGHYDMSGDFAFRVGLPGKSGVGGGILAIVPGIASIAVWSPGLNAAGNSLVGTLALERLSGRANINLF